MSTSRITAVGVMVPARDESETIQECLRGLRAAVRALPADIEAAVCVVADRCTDDTAALAAEALDGWTDACVVVNRAELTIGELRDLGLRQACGRLADHRPDTVWLLSTDADSTVAADWLTAHLRLAEAGAHAVAGVAELARRCRLPEAVARRYSALLAATVHADGHGNVYGANLGVRADAYHAVGGFGAVRTGEDHDLWRRLGRAGFRRRYSDRAIVRTSARRRGRAPGGLADLLSELDSSAPDLSATLGD